MADDSRGKRGANVDEQVDTQAGALVYALLGVPARGALLHDCRDGDRREQADAPCDEQEHRATARA